MDAINRQANRYCHRREITEELCMVVEFIIPFGKRLVLGKLSGGTEKFQAFAHESLKFYSLNPETSQ
jgi:hypothetical protein